VALIPKLWTARLPLEIKFICHRLARHLLASKKMSHKEDTIPEGYAYAWTPVSNLSLEDFLKKARTSQLMISFNTNTRPV